jgi:hypothetical protein
MKVWVGLDSNNDGVPDYNDELLASTTEEQMNHCDITNPCRHLPWSSRTAAAARVTNGTNPLETYSIATAVVPGGGGNGLSINGPAATTGTPVSPTSAGTCRSFRCSTGDVAYAGFDVGAANAPATSVPGRSRSRVPSTT